MAKQLYRSTSNRMIAGVCAGFADYVDVDPTLVRVLTVLAALTTGGLPLLVTYVVASFIVPEDTQARGQGG
jgi:phage shock protein C